MKEFNAGLIAVSETIFKCLKKKKNEIPALKERGRITRSGCSGLGASNAGFLLFVESISSNVERGFVPTDKERERGLFVLNIERASSEFCELVEWADSFPLMLDDDDDES